MARPEALIAEVFDHLARFRPLFQPRVVTALTDCPGRHEDFA
jgi:hypothetical protein